MQMPIHDFSIVRPGLKPQPMRAGDGPVKMRFNKILVGRPRHASCYWYPKMWVKVSYSWWDGHGLSHQHILQTGIQFPLVDLIAI